MAGPTLGAPLLLHLGLEDVPRPLLQLVADPHARARGSRSSSRRRTPRRSETSTGRRARCGRSCRTPNRSATAACPAARSLSHASPKEQVGVPHQLMKRVQMPAGALDVLQRLGHLADRLDRLVADPVRPAVEAPSESSLSSSPSTRYPGWPAAIGCACAEAWRGSTSVVRNPHAGQPFTTSGRARSPRRCSTSAFRP